MTFQPAARPDPAFDQLVREIRQSLGVPVALVSVVGEHRQVLPGAAGLPDPWQRERQTPLTHSFCQYVVADNAPLIVADARADPRLRDSLAIQDLGVTAYAGVPLRADGHTIGAVCAIDSHPRTWQRSELDRLAEFAEACAVELDRRQASPRPVGRNVHTIEFTCEPAAVAMARQWARSQLTNAVRASPRRDDLVDSIELLVSELVTNAVRAGSREVGLTLEFAPEHISVSANDDAAGTPTVTHAAELAGHGRGLTIVAALSDDWGVLLHPTGKAVWATLPLG